MMYFLSFDSVRSSLVRKGHLFLGFPFLVVFRWVVFAKYGHQVPDRVRWGIRVRPEKDDAIGRE